MDYLIRFSPTFSKAGERAIGCETKEISYYFALDFSAERKRFEIIKDILKLKCKFFEFDKTKSGFTKRDFIGNGTISIDSSNRTPRFLLQLPTSFTEKEFIPNSFELSYIQKYAARTKLKSRELYINSTPIFPSKALMLLKTMLRKVGTYDFDARLSKKPQLITGRVELEPDGSNLPVVINHILKNKDRKQKFYNMVQDLLPFVDGYQIQNIADTILYTLRETYAPGRPFPAFLLSDGTINLTSLIICLFFEDKTLKIIEEPERNIHPRLISKVIDLMNEASTIAQIITTTHNPEVVRYSNMNDLLLIRRSKDGLSEISRPANTERVKAFLKEEMGIEELYVQNLL